MKLESIMYLDILFPILFIIFHVINAQYGNTGFDEICASLTCICSSNNLFICMNFIRWGLNISGLESFYFCTVHLILCIKYSNRKVMIFVFNTCCHLFALWNILLFRKYSFASPLYCFTLDLCKSRFFASLFFHYTLKMETSTFSFTRVFKSFW